MTMLMPLNTNAARLQSCNSGLNFSEAASPSRRGGMRDAGGDDCGRSLAGEDADPARPPDEERHRHQIYGTSRRSDERHIGVIEATGSGQRGGNRPRQRRIQLDLDLAGAFRKPIRDREAVAPRTSGPIVCDVDPVTAIAQLEQQSIGINLNDSVGHPFVRGLAVEIDDETAIGRGDRDGLDPPSLRLAARRKLDGRRRSLMLVLAVGDSIAGESQRAGKHHGRTGMPQAAAGGFDGSSHLLSDRFEKVSPE
ncbi:MAG: hypothetical protein HYR63_01675 [Proteobacteria bacterium]|nr:hypothetical protein [Pseudomonadota bacterium]